ncbi:HAD hydrolase-like protein, partial [Streptomyces sp. CSDS2]|uniref:HAD family hydrolase n=1 Tax=Streptomyces sp. CSDS2 TaxID=3055051 RepID=UPI0025B16381
GAFLAACDALSLAPREVAYVGDHPEIDGRGAAEAGLLSVWIDRGGACATLDPPAGPRRPSAGACQAAGRIPPRPCPGVSGSPPRRAGGCWCWPAPCGC